jgi:hypothetical protein
VTREPIEGLAPGVMVCGVISDTQRVQHGSGCGLSRVRIGVLSEKRGLVPVRSRRMRRETRGGLCGHSGALSGDDLDPITTGNYPQFA